MTRGVIPGATARDRAIRLAGAFAELGITRITLRSPDALPEDLRARGIDLPARILSAPAGSVLECASPGIRVSIGPDGLDWESDDAAVVQSLSPI